MKILRQNNGQVMLLSMLILGGILLGASTLAGLLMLYQFRQASNVGESTQALFAADAGMEWGLYCVIKVRPAGSCNSIPRPAFTNGANFTVAFYPSTSTPRDGYTSMRSVGISGRTSRAFELFIEGATTTLP